MVSDPWLPVGLKLPGGEACRSALYEGQDWQVFETTAGGRALIARDALATRWISEGVLSEGTLAPMRFGTSAFQVLLSEPRHVLVPLESATSPSSHAEAIAFAVSLRETRRLVPTAPLHDGIYVERVSRLLPTWSLSEAVPDDVVLGRWLSGGVRVSVKSFRRLASLLSWLTPTELRTVLTAAGFTGPDGESGVAIPVGVVVADPADRPPSRDPHAQASETKAPFRLPGRSELERFFREHVIDIVENAETYRALGIEFPSPVVLHGPPGCGKTFAVEQLIDYLGWPSFSVDSSTIGSPYIHETGKKIAKTFDDALKASPAVIVIDEMESFLSDRQLGGGQALHHVEEVAEFLRRIPDAIKNHVLLIGMTNRIEMIDPAILRRGRFDHVIHVSMPSEEEVRSLLAALLDGRPGGATVNIDALIPTLVGRPLSDVSFVVREAARLAARSGRTSLDHASLDQALRSLPPRSDSAPAANPIGFRRA